MLAGCEFTKNGCRTTATMPMLTKITHRFQNQT
eukprot:SAG31_NODE_362_length_16904_cov_7.893218_13_plen_33_part_00